MEDNNIRHIQAEQQAVLEKRFNDNIQSFKKYLPDIGREFENYLPNKLSRFVFSTSGIPNVIFNNNEPFFKCDDPLFFCRKQVLTLIETNPTFRPYKNGVCIKGNFHDKFLSQIINKVSFDKLNCPSVKDRGYLSSVIIFGIGLGYQISELLERVEVVNLVLIEPDKDIFYASLFCFDWTNILTYFSENTFGLKIILGDNDISTKVYEYFSWHGNFLATNLLYYVHYKNKQIERIRDEVFRKLYDLTSAPGFVDDTFYGISHACWSILKRKSFVTRTPLRNEYRDLPVFIVASGPSLDNDLPFLRKYQDKAIIIACGTALDVLYHAGIYPDFYANTERTPEIRQSLDVLPDERFFEDIILLSSDVCHPFTVSKFKNTALFGKADETVYKIVSENFAEYRSIQYITNMNPLVGNMGIAGALFLGFRKLYLFGVDCGKISQNGKIHSTLLSLYNQHGCSDTTDRFSTSFEVEGNFNKVCSSNALFQFSLRKIEEVLDIFLKKKSSLVECFNCSDGCKIKNTIPVHSAELDSKFETIKNIDKEEFRTNFLKEKISTINLSESQIVSLFNRKQLRVLCDELIAFIRKKRTSRIDYIRMMEDIYEHLSYLQTTKEYFINVKCICGTLNQSFFVLTQALYFYSEDKEALDAAEKITEVIVDYLTELPEIYSHLPYYIMGQEKVHYPNGLVGRDLPHCKSIMFNDTPVLVQKDYDDPQKIFEKRYE